MARFKQVPQHYLLGKLMEYWRNMVRNYNGDVRDSDFFEIIGNRCPHERALKLIKGVWTSAGARGVRSPLRGAFPKSRGCSSFPTLRRRF